MKFAIWILWPSFVVAAAANAVFFTMFDPLELHMHWQSMPSTRIGAYTVGFFAFWAMAASSSALTCFFQRTAVEVNQLWCPLPNAKRPPGCRMVDPR